METFGTAAAGFPLVATTDTDAIASAEKIEHGAANGYVCEASPCEGAA